jgi:flagellar hook-basal body complex protein FliE
MSQIAGIAGSIASAGSTGTTTPTLTTPGADRSSSDVAFSGFFRSMVDQASSAETTAQQTVGGLLNGSGVEVHEAMIATQKADLSFELGLQVRNKAVAAYQQMMGMQF